MNTKTFHSVRRFPLHWVGAVVAAYLSTAIVADALDNNLDDWDLVLNTAAWMAMLLLLGISRFLPPKSGGWMEVLKKTSLASADPVWLERVKTVGGVFALGILVAFGSGIARSAIRDLLILRILQGAGQATILSCLALLVRWDSLRYRREQEAGPFEDEDANT